MIKLSNLKKNLRNGEYTQAPNHRTITLLPNSTTQRKGDLMILLLKCGQRLLIYKVILADLYLFKGRDSKSTTIGIY